MSYSTDLGWRLGAPYIDRLMQERGPSIASALVMTSSNGNIFGVTGPLCGEFTGHR